MKISELTFKSWVKERTKKISSQQRETKIYIETVLEQFLKEPKIPENEIYILEFEKAQREYNFSRFQILADWIFYCLIFNEAHLLNHCPQDYYIAIGQRSYYNCYKMLNKEWKLFEEMADCFEIFVDNIKYSEVNIKTNQPLLTFLGNKTIH